MNEQIIGYHGTKKSNVASICSKNFRINRDKYNKLYLGAGVYFFFYLDDALDWNVKSFKREYRCYPEWNKLINTYSIIESLIEVDEKDILDLDKKENLFKLEILKKKIDEKLKDAQNYQNASNKTSAIINFLYEIKEIRKKVLIKTFFEKIGTKNFDELKLYPRKMLCVKDVSIISKNKEKINIEESLFNSIMYFYS